MNKLAIKKHEKIIVIDTETANGLENPLVYDIGFQVINREGEVIENHSYCISEILFDNELMTSAYYNEKVPQYLRDLQKGLRKLRTFEEVRNILYSVCKKYRVKKIFAHNAFFDVKALNTTLRYLTKSSKRFFLPFDIEIWDSLKMSREIFGNIPEYHTFCKDNNFTTARGLSRMTAEVLYRYLTKNVDFVESHTGLEDVQIETEIVLFCISMNPRIDGQIFKPVAVA